MYYEYLEAGDTTKQEETDNIYNYDIANYLDNVEKINKNKKIHLCIYRISQRPYDKCYITKPYISFLMYKYTNPELIFFPVIDKISKLNKFLSTVFDNSWKSNVIGYYEYEDNVFLFIQAICLNKSDILKQQSDDIWWWTLVDEIINTKHCMGYKIHTFVTNFFINNSWSILLYDNLNNLLETPSVLYCGDKYNTVLFQIVFGLSRRTHWASLGSFIYFSPFDSALNFSIKGSKIYMKPSKEQEIPEEKERSGIIRCVIFGKTQRVFLNAKKDPEKELTEIEKLKMKDKSVDVSIKKSILKTSRMKDNDGEWIKKYDSAVISKDYSYMQQVIKNRNNYTILNYCEVDKKNAKIL